MHAYDGRPRVICEPKRHSFSESASFAAETVIKVAFCIGSTDIKLVGAIIGATALAHGRFLDFQCRVSRKVDPRAQGRVSWRENPGEIFKADTRFKLIEPNLSSC